MARNLRLRPRRRTAPRSTSSAACNAPFTSMYLDQRGQVRACCQNDYHLLGNITEQRLVEIWRGDAAQELRRAMDRHDLALGCDFCEWQVAKGRSDLAFARWFDEFPVTVDDPDWPRQLEMAVSNTCNLQCVMCDGEWSSSIRAQREGLPPLPKVYGDSFFEDLTDFLPHLDRVKFLGGEPFLAAETLRVMDLLVSLGLRTECHVTTNGTQWTPRVERILDGLPVGVSVSVDAATAATYESIRVGSSWETLLANLDRFQERAEAHDTYLGLTYCLMVPNWHEFHDFCRFADQRGLEAAVNTVRHPHHLSLYMLDAAELAEVVEGMEATDRDRADRLGASRVVWDRELARLRAQLADRRSGASVPSVDTWRPNPKMVRPFNHDPASASETPATPPAHATQPGSVPVTVTVTAGPGVDAERAARAEVADRRRLAAVGEHPARLWIDAAGAIAAADTTAEALGIDPATLLGVQGSDLPDVLGRSIDLSGPPVVEADEDGHQTLRITAADGDDLLVFTAPAAPHGGPGPGTWVYLTRSSRR